MATTTEDVLPTEAVEFLFEKALAEHRQFSRAYREHDAQNINSGSATFRQTDGLEWFEGEIVEIPEGTDYPRVSADYGEAIQAVYSKYGVEIPVTDEAVSDSRVDVTADTVQNINRAEAVRIDGVAADMMADNLSNVDGPIDVEDNADGAIADADLLRAQKLLFGRGYNLNNLEVIVGPDGMEDMFSLDRFTDIAEVSQYILETGRLQGADLSQGLLGVWRGMPVYATNTVDVAAGEAYLYDPTNFGYHSIREPTDVSTYREEQKDQTVYKLRGRAEWVVTDPMAAIKIES